LSKNGALSWTPSRLPYCVCATLRTPILIAARTLDQKTERQLDGIRLDKVFTDKASGKDTNRPQLTAALEYVWAGDTLLVHSMDRLARNAEDLLRIVRELVGPGVSVEFGKNHLTFSGKGDPMAKPMLTMLAAFGEFERELIRERQREGIAIAKARSLQGPEESSWAGRGS
jgi:DNA invertase Pin-like site-specific DNA recombinase